MTNTDPQGEKRSGNPDVDELRDQIDHTRDELAQTVEALAAKADVKGRTKDKAAELSAQAKERAAELSAQAKERAATAAAQAKERAAVVAAQARQTAQHGSHVAQEKTGTAREKLPTTVRDQPVILLAAGGLGLIVLLSWLARRLTR
jgi:ABC-type transporter Mla subunit MlaD